MNDEDTGENNNTIESRDDYQDCVDGQGIRLLSDDDDTCHTCRELTPPLTTDLPVLSSRGSD